MIDISTKLSTIRMAFIDIQNKAEFVKSSKLLANCFKDLLTIDGDYNGNKISLWSSKKKVIIKFDINEKSLICVLNKNEANYADIFDYDKFNIEKNGIRFTDIVEIRNSEIANKLIKLISSLFTGKNFDILENYGN